MGPVTSKALRAVKYEGAQIQLIRFFRTPGGLAIAGSASFHRLPHAKERASSEVLDRKGPTLVFLMSCDYC